MLMHKEPTKSEIVYDKHHRSAAFAYIRWHARRVIMKSVPQICGECGYSLTVEVCHIRSISSFPDDAKLSEINTPENLVLLCPNHHWLRDNDSLEEKDHHSCGQKHDESHGPKVLKKT